MKVIILFLLLIGIVITTPTPDTFILSFAYAARQGLPLQSSLANVIWNNNIVASIVPTDNYIHNTITIEVTAVVGDNSLQFEGAGLSDGAGLGISNVALIQKGNPTNQNVIRNGDFSDHNLQADVANLKNIPGWTPYKGVIKIAYGFMYNDQWGVFGGIQVVELDALANYQITQILTFDSSYNVIGYPDPTPPPKSALFPLPTYFLQFDWAPNTVGTSNILTSQGNVLWNNVVLDSLVPTNSGVNHYSKQVTLSSSNQNTLQFDGAQNGDGFGVSISNVKVKATTLTSPNLLNSIWTVANPLYASCSTFNTQWTASQCFSLDSGTNQRYTQKVTIILPVQKAFDVVGPLTRTAFGCLKQQGYTFVNVRVDSNTPGVINPNAIQTLKNAQDAGLATAIYMVLCRSLSYRNTFPVIGRIPMNLYSSIWLKIIQNSNTGCKWQDYNHDDNCNFIRNTLFFVHGNGYNYGDGLDNTTTGVYSTSNLWNKFFGTSCNIAKQNKFHLWYTNYQTNGKADPTQSFIDFTVFGGFGGWTKPDLKQTVGGVRVKLCNNPLWHAFISVDWHP